MHSNCWKTELVGPAGGGNFASVVAVSRMGSKAEPVVAEGWFGIGVWCGGSGGSAVGVVGISCSGE